MSNTGTKASGFFANIMHWLKTAALTAESAIAAKLKASGEANNTNIIGALETTGSDAMAPIEALTEKYLPVALDQVVTAAKDAALGPADKRESVVTHLLNELEADGHDITAEGTTSFVNLLVELAVNVGKAVMPGILGSVLHAKT